MYLPIYILSNNIARLLVRPVKCPNTITNPNTNPIVNTNPNQPYT